MHSSSVVSDIELVSTGSYAHPGLQKLVKGLKFSGYKECARVLGLRIATQLRHVVSLEEIPALVLVPLPLSRWRKNKRGFNQSELIARAIGTELNLPVADILRRKHRKAQSDLPHARRAQNIRGAFYVVKPNAISEKVVVLVDDVVTTGSTLRACSSAILQEVRPKRLLAAVAAHG